MEDAALFIKNLLSTYWTASNADNVTPRIIVGYDTNAVTKLRAASGFANNADIVFVKEVPNSYTSKPNQIGGGTGWRTRVRINIWALSASSSASITPQQHTLKLIQECERIVRAQVMQGTTYSYIETVGGSNDNNVTNNWGKYRLEVELMQMNVTS